VCMCERGRGGGGKEEVKEIWCGDGSDVDHE
jgi:hypothetical protein